MLRIETTSDGQTKNIRLIGRMREEHLPAKKEQAAVIDAFSPAGADEPWVLSATILGSSMPFIRSRFAGFGTTPFSAGKRSTQAPLKLTDALPKGSSRSSLGRTPGFDKAANQLP